MSAEVARSEKRGERTFLLPPKLMRLPNGRREGVLASALVSSLTGASVVVCMKKG